MSTAVSSTTAYSFILLNLALLLCYQNDDCRPNYFPKAEGTFQNGTVTRRDARDRPTGPEGKISDTGNRTPSCRVRGGNVSRYTISDTSISLK
jgi:hypothetical protein